jgi:hypothetical protein
VSVRVLEAHGFATLITSLLYPRLMTEGVQLVVPAPFAIAIGWACGKAPPKYN